MEARPELLAWLLVGHLAGDYLFQTAWMAEGKAGRWLPLFLHSAVYTLCIVIVSLPVGGLSPRGVLVIFLAHLVLDQRRLVAWWAGKICRADQHSWLGVMIDQSWHALVLALASLL